MPPRSGKSQEADNTLVESYRSVRRALGLLGLTLPPLLLVVAALTEEVTQPSISAYYYGAAGNIFVGTLCAMAVFLWSYVGYQDDGQFPSDKLVSRLAAASALVVAFVPTGKIPAADTSTCTFLECLVLRATPFNPTYVHLVAAGVFFALLAVFCLVNFRRTGGLAISAEKGRKNRAFLICGLIILACLALLAWRGYLYETSDQDAKTALGQTQTVFILESIAVWAFAFAWLVKGEAFKHWRRG
jgi:hypothetical protein